MKPQRTLLAAALVLALAGPAQAVHLDPSGRGQALIYPYYTVNHQQQTLLSVTNTTGASQALKLRFHEGYNSRAVLDFNLWLSPYDVWTATVFALEDAGIADAGTGILTSDTSCTTPRFVDSNLNISGRPYVPFSNLGYSGTSEDGGPSDNGRTREGWIEIIAMADLTPPLSTYIAHLNGAAPTGCVQAGNHPIAQRPTARPSGGLIGAASIINVGQGTLLATRAEALGGFTGVGLFSGIGNAVPNLASVNDSAENGTATAHLFDAAGRAQDLIYSTDAASGTRPVDAVSAVLAADQVYNEYSTSSSVDAGSDWVLTFPTKSWYTDPLTSGSTTVRPPFEEIFDAASCVGYDREQYSRETTTRTDPGTPPTPFARPPLCYTANVLGFQSGTVAESAVLGSRLLTSFYVDGYLPPAEAGWLKLNLDSASAPHGQLASSNGKVMRGLPVIGFWASNLVNNNVSNGVLSNYSASLRHSTSARCVTAADGGACP